MMKKPWLGRAESEVLRYVADEGDVTISKVGCFLAQTKGQTRGTAANMLERLRKKGFLQRREVDGSYRYSLTESREPMYEGLIEDFVKTVLGGSLVPLGIYLGRKAEFGEKRFRLLQDLVRDLEANRDDA